jgi:hypothetical protein
MLQELVQAVVGVFHLLSVTCNAAAVGVSKQWGGCDVVACDMAVAISVTIAAAASVTILNTLRNRMRM